jgi:tetratricopeptide (TPR) repeat protein
VTRWIALLVLVAGTARADVWERAIERGNPDPNRENYEKLMREGDELSVQATIRSSSPAAIRRTVKQAAAAYRSAAAAEPREAEPWFRLGYVLYAFYFQCNESRFPRGGPVLCNPDPMLFDRQRAEEIIEAWDEFEARAPLDPRLSIVDNPYINQFYLLFDRAILHTKLATKEHLEAATRDYKKFIDRSDSGPSGLIHNALSNLAETYMMQGNLEDAIDTYRAALAKSASADTAYGLAVALDRDDRGAEAAEIIVKQGWQSFYGQTGFRTRVTITHETFFVPQGEQDYYFALIYEAFGYDDDALRNWKSYIQSGAHSEFQPRAKQHIEALLAKQKAHPDESLRHAPEVRIDFP